MEDTTLQEIQTLKERINELEEQILQRPTKSKIFSHENTYTKSCVFERLITCTSLEVPGLQSLITKEYADGNYRLDTNVCIGKNNGVGIPALKMDTLDIYVVTIPKLSDYNLLYIDLSDRSDLENVMLNFASDISNGEVITIQLLLSSAINGPVTISSVTFNADPATGFELNPDGSMPDVQVTATPHLFLGDGDILASPQTPRLYTITATRDESGNILVFSKLT